MSLRSQAVAIWKDPVGSNVIAGVIVAIAGSLYWVATHDSASTFLAHPVTRLGIPGVMLTIILLLWYRFRPVAKILVFLSAGGTCRDPMAKVITTRLLESKMPKARIEVRAAGLGPLSATEASFAARYVMNEMYGEDLLKNHRPELLTPELVEKAALILVMERALLLTPGKTLPSNKTFVLKEFFGQNGDIVDPWPDGKDPVTIQRYRQCAEELRCILTERIDQIVDALKV